MSTLDRILNQPNAPLAVHPAIQVQQTDAYIPSATLAVSVIIPAYNEEAGVATQIRSIQRTLDEQHLIHEVLVVDDGSSDRTADEALGAGAFVLQHPENRGYGAAIKTGILAARFDVIVIIDADGTYPSREIPALVAKLETADMVVGSRTGNDVHIPKARQLPKWFLRWLASRIVDKAIPDLNSGMRAFRRNCVLQYFPILSNRFSFTTTSTLAFLADNYRVIYHPIDYYERVGKSKIRPWHFMDFTVLVLRMAMLFQPMRVFVPAAFLCGFLGLLKVGFDIFAYGLRTGTFGWSLLYQPVLSISAILLLLVGFQLLLIGMLADGLLRRISQHNGPLEPSHAVVVRRPEAIAAGETLEL